MNSDQIYDHIFTFEQNKTEEDQWWLDYVIVHWDILPKHSSLKLQQLNETTT